MEKQGLYKWLPIVFGCHCRPERSFRYHGRPFPICARCTGELMGMLVGLVSCIWVRPPLYLILLLAIPLLVDGFTQLWTSYTSKNWLRCVTGILFGYALSAGFLMSVRTVYNWGYTYGMTHFH